MNDQIFNKVGIEHNIQQDQIKTRCEFHNSLH